MSYEESGGDALIAAWKKEQEEVASLVRVYRDDSVDERVVAGEHPGFRVLLPLFGEDGVSLPRPGNPGTPEAPNNNCYYGGLDVSFSKPATHEDEQEHEHEDQHHPLAVAVYVVLDGRTLETVYRDHLWCDPSSVPYVPSFLAAREAGPLVDLVWRQRSALPEVTPAALLVDGNGVFHPRRAGLASVVGVRTGLPAIGVAKSLLSLPLPPPASGGDGDGTGNGGGDQRWTRDGLDARIDGLLARIHRFAETGGLGSENSVGRSAKERPFAPAKGGPRGWILANLWLTGWNDSGGEAVPGHRPFFPRREVLRDLSGLCRGIALPLEAAATHHDRWSRERAGPGETDDPFRTVLGNAVVGHGGGGRARGSNSRNNSNNSGNSNRTTVATKPVFVSVGHELSLAEATRIAVSLSKYRIPEPVRQADLYGRELMRRASQAGK